MRSLLLSLYSSRFVKLQVVPAPHPRAQGLGMGTRAALLVNSSGPKNSTTNLALANPAHVNSSQLLHEWIKLYFDLTCRTHADTHQSVDANHRDLITWFLVLHSSYSPKSVSRRPC